MHLLMRELAAHAEIATFRNMLECYKSFVS